MDKEKLFAWIDEHVRNALSLYEEAQKMRSDGDYEDVDALEQSVYNEAVMETLAELKTFIERDDSSERENVLDRIEKRENSEDYKIQRDTPCSRCLKPIRDKQYVCHTIKTDSMPTPAFYYYHVGCKT